MLHRLKQFCVDVEKWTYQNFNHPQLGCLLVRPRSLSATCLNIISSSINNSSFDAPHNDNGDDEEVKEQNKRWKLDNANDDEHKLGCNSMKISKYVLFLSTSYLTRPRSVY